MGSSTLSSRLTPMGTLLTAAEVDLAFRRREQAIIDYGASWWLDDEQALDAMERHPRLRSLLTRLAKAAGSEDAGPVTTEDVFADLDMAWDSDRRALQAWILSRVFTISI